MKKFYRNLISVVSIVSLSIAMLSCGSKPSVNENTAPADQTTLLDSQLIKDESVPKSSTTAPEADTSNYSEKVLSEIGITLQLPEAYVNTDGFIHYSNFSLGDGTGVYLATVTYVGMPEDEYKSLINADHLLTEEESDYLQESCSLIFAIFAIDEGRDASDLVDFVNGIDDMETKLSESELTKLTEVDGCTFYDYDFGDTYNPKLDGVYQTEFDTLVSLKDELIQNATFVAPVRPFADVIGTKLSFKTTDLNGNEVTSEQIFSKSEITMVNIWATWCGFCVDELPELEKINERLGKKNCAIIGIMGDDDADQETIDLGKAILEDSGVTYLNILPWDGWENIRPESWPTTFFVDKAGYIVGSPIQGAYLDQYEPRVESILAGEVSLPIDETVTSSTSDGSYKIYVVDENKNPISGVTVQFCASEICKMAVTGENGMISFDDPEGIAYEVHILKTPEGYAQDTSLYLTETTYSDLTIVLKKE